MNQDLIDRGAKALNDVACLGCPAVFTFLTNEPYQQLTPTQQWAAHTCPGAQRTLQDEFREMERRERRHQTLADGVVIEEADDSVVHRLTPPLPEGVRDVTVEDWGMGDILVVRFENGMALSIDALSLTEYECSAVFHRDGAVLGTGEEPTENVLACVSFDPSVEGKPMVEAAVYPR